MMNKYFFSLLISLTFVLICQSILASPARSIYCGRLEGSTHFDSLKVIYFPSSLNDQKVVFMLRVEQNGFFKFCLPIMSRVYRIQLIDGFGKDILTSKSQYNDFKQIGIPGDSVYLNCRFVDDKWILDASGNGASKYAAWRYIDFTFPSVENKRLSEIDSICLSKVNELSVWRGSLEPEIFNIVVSDMAGKIYSDALGWKFGNCLSGDSSAVLQLDLSFETFKDYVLNNVKVNKNVAAYSPSMVDLLYRLPFYETIFKEKSTRINANELFAIYRERFTGYLRDILVTSYLNDSLFRGYIYFDPRDYKSSLEQAVTFIHDSILSGQVHQLLRSRAPGVGVMDFGLPRDSSDERMHIKALRNKVLLIDFWSYQCGGCAHFAKSFHESIYPKLKDRDDFEVVSIMLDKFADKKKYLKRLRGEGSMKTDGVDFTYTFKDYINLYAGKGEDQMVDSITRFYQIKAFPFLLLIDKRGEIVSSTLPVPQEPNDEKIKTLSLLIDSALNMK